MGFNDNNFDASTYVGVNQRLQQFWEKYPSGRVETEVGYNDGVLIVMARLYRDEKTDKPVATGHSFLEGLSGEKVGEYTETVAVGRALAMAGFGVEKSIASSEEMKRFSNRKSNKDTKVTENTEEVEVKKFVGSPIVETRTETEASKDLPRLKTKSMFKLPKREEVKQD